MTLTYQDMMKKMGLKGQKRDVGLEEYVNTGHRR